MKTLPALLVLILPLITSSPVCGFQADNLTLPASTPPDPDFSPHGPYLGPLTLPHIVRYRELPMRMHLEPLILPPKVILTIDQRMVPLFERVLREATDLEVQEVAALALARVAVEDVADLSHCETALRDVLKSSASKRIRNACGYALAAGNFKAAESDLVNLAADSDDTERLLLEPALARWKAASAADLWRPRLSDRLVSTISYRLAAEGLAALNDATSVSLLNGTATDASAVFAKRMSAAAAIARLDPEQAYASAQTLITGSIPDRLLAAALLDNKKAESHISTASLCNDTADGVASIAWQQVFRHHPDLLIDHLAAGRNHRDAQIRMTAARTIELFPTAERVTWLHEQLSDVHIEVRNVARQMLFKVAQKNAELKDQIVGMSSDILKPESQNWQGMEQALVLLGQLQATRFSPLCVPLLDHPREEVNISAAWLIQMFPDDTIRDLILTYIEKADKRIATPGEAWGELPLKQAFLLQYGGLVRLREIQPIMEKKFDKMDPGGYQVRAAAMWVLGIFFEKNPVPELAAKFEERIKDRGGIPPESENVRRMSVMALGLMRAKASLPCVNEAYKVDPGDSLIPGTARWVLPMLGEPLPPEIPPAMRFSGGWRLKPIEDP